MPEPEFLTVEEVADRLRVSKMTVYRLIHEDELPYAQIGRSYRIPRAMFERYLSAVTQGGTGAAS